MQFVREYGMIDNKLFEEIKEFVENDPGTFDKSELYSSVKDLKYIDENERFSVYKKIRDNKLFSLIDSLISLINMNENHYQFMLFKNDITYIKYSVGGFFKPHEDYLSVTSNMIQEFTFILCIDSNCYINNKNTNDINENGETMLHINNNYKYKSYNTIKK
eukprot:3722_1